MLLGLTITVKTSTVMDDSMKFCGDHRFPPGRPPIPGIGKPDQTESINEAFAVWAQAPPVSSTEHKGPWGLEAAMAELGRLFGAFKGTQPELEESKFVGKEPNIVPMPTLFRYSD